jgi:hypothetical protein
MSGKSDLGNQWRQTLVVIRSDIYSKAVEMGLDISDELNLRLAGRLGIEYWHEQLSDRPLPERIVGAADSKVKRETESRQKPQIPVLHPVINADDPASAVKVRKARRQVVPVPVLTIPVPDMYLSPEKDKSPVHLASDVHMNGLTKSGKSKKTGKDDVLKKFITSKITRVDADDAVISKDDMYQAFTRWCRDHRIVTLPERRVFATLLKNKYAITEKTINGTSCWVHVRLS